MNEFNALIEDNEDDWEDANEQNATDESSRIKEPVIISASKPTDSKKRMPRAPTKNDSRVIRFGGNLATVNQADKSSFSFQEQAMIVREQCMAERSEATTRAIAPTVTLQQDKPVLALPSQAQGQVQGPRLQG